MKTKLIAGIIIVSATILAITSVWNDSPIVVKSGTPATGKRFSRVGFKFFDIESIGIQYTILDKRY